MKKVIFKDFLQSLIKSKGRFLSIFFLIFLGTFAFVGLKAAGPDMRLTANKFSKEMNIADTTIISTWGLDKSDQEIIKAFDNVSKVEFGYFQDNELNDSSKSLRLFSSPDKISKYVIDSGRLPNSTDEIALDFSQKKDYKINEKISFKKLKDDDLLKEHSFRIVGFVKSSEAIETADLGPSSVGTGKLSGYGIVLTDNFDSKLYTIARLTFKNTKNLNRNSSTYKNKVKDQESKISKILSFQATSRLNKTKADEQKKIDNDWGEISKAKSQLLDGKKKLEDAHNELENGADEISRNQKELASGIASGQSELEEGANQIASAKGELASAEKVLQEARSQIDAGKSDLQTNWIKLQSAKEKLKSGKKVLDTSNNQLSEAASELDAGKKELDELTSQLAAYAEEITRNQEELNQGQSQITSQKEEIEKSQAELSVKQKELDSQLSTIEEKNKELLEKINSLKKELSDKNKLMSDVQKKVEAITAEINQLNDKKQKAENDQDAEEVARLEVEIHSKENEKNTLVQQEEKLELEHSQIQKELDNTEKNYQEFYTDSYQPTMTSINEHQAELDAVQSNLDHAKQEILNQQDSLNQQQKELDSSKQEVNKQKKQLSENQQLLSAKESEYQKGLKEFNEGITSYNNSLEIYYEGLNEWQTAFASLKAGSDEYEANQAAYIQGKTELAEQENELAKGKLALQNEQEKNQKQIENAKDELARGQEDYEKGLVEYDRQSEDAAKEIPNNEKKLKEAQKELNQLTVPIYTVKNHEEFDTGYKAFVDSSDRIDILSNVFPVFLFAVAALVSLTTMTRFVEEERLNMGIYKAMGYSDWDIKKKFLLYGVLASLLGTILGTVVGHMLLPKIIYDVYAGGTSLPNIHFSIYPIYTLIGFIIAFLCTVVSTYVVITKDLNERPATLLLPKPPKEGSRIFLERVTPIWRNMSFNHKITARNLFRYKKRMLMTILGVAGCMALLITAFGIKDSIAGITKRQSEELLKYDLLVSKEDSINEASQNSIDNLLSSKDIREYTDIYYEEVTASAPNNSTQSITELVTDNPSKIKNFISLKDANSFVQQKMPTDGVVLSEKLADLLGVKIGDQITFTSSKKQKYKAKVAQITEMYLGHFMFMSSQVYTEIYEKDYKDNGYLINLKDSSSAGKDNQSTLFMKQEGINGVVQSNGSEDGSIEGLSQITLLLIAGASLLALVVIYTLSNINVSERIRELSTIKVLGFYDQEVTLYIYRETILLSVIGILIGSIGGTILTKFITTILPTDEVMFDTAIKWTNYATSAFITMGITLGLMVFIHNKIKRVNMLDALKSVD